MDKVEVLTAMSGRKRLGAFANADSILVLSATPAIAQVYVEGLFDCKMYLRPYDQAVSRGKQ